MTWKRANVLKRRMFERTWGNVSVFVVVSGERDTPELRVTKGRRHGTMVFLYFVSLLYLWP